MSDEYDDDSRARRKAKSGDSTVKTLLIIFGSLAAVALLTCCGVGFGAYFWVKKNLGQAIVTVPADIQKITTEITDITIPPEFVPKSGSSTFIMKMAQYQWCPSGNCPERTDGQGHLILMAMGLQDASGRNNPARQVFDEQVSDETLKEQWKEYTKTEHDFVIRGKKCKFTVVEGEQHALVMSDDDDEDQPAESATEKDDMPDDGASAHASGGTGPKAVHISGSFPGKDAECMLQIQLTAEEYDEEKILGMLKSIK